MLALKVTDLGQGNARLASSAYAVQHTMHDQDRFVKEISKFNEHFVQQRHLTCWKYVEAAYKCVRLPGSVISWHLTSSALSVVSLYFGNGK